MTKHEEYYVKFKKHYGKRVSFSAEQIKVTSDSFHIAHLLNCIDNEIESEALLYEIIAALNGQPYDSEFLIDGSFAYNDCTIVPPNALLGNDEYPFLLTELKLILEEWLNFLKS